MTRDDIEICFDLFHTGTIDPMPDLRTTTRVLLEELIRFCWEHAKRRYSRELGAQHYPLHVMFAELPPRTEGDYSHYGQTHHGRRHRLRINYDTALAFDLYSEYQSNFRPLVITCVELIEVFAHEVIHMRQCLQGRLTELKDTPDLFEMVFEGERLSWNPKTISQDEYENLPHEREAQNLSAQLVHEIIALPQFSAFIMDNFKTADGLTVSVVVNGRWINVSIPVKLPINRIYLNMNALPDQEELTPPLHECYPA